MKRKQDKSTITEKNTKQEILEAYDELLGSLGNTPISKETLLTITKVDDSLEKSISTTVSNLVKQFREAEKILEEIGLASLLQKKALEDEKKAALKQQAREKEEYDYEFSKTKQRQKVELEEERTLFETELAKRKDALTAQEKEIISLRNEVQGFEDRLSKTIKETTEQTTKDLKTKFENEKNLFAQQAEARELLLKQKVESLESLIVSQKDEIARLNTALSETSKQLTSIAERAVTKTISESSKQTSLQ